MRTCRALSVAAPAGAKIRDGRKRIEGRQWRPDVLPLCDLLIVENRLCLSSPGVPRTRMDGPWRCIVLLYGGHEQGVADTHRIEGQSWDGARITNLSGISGSIAERKF